MLICGCGAIGSLILILAVIAAGLVAVVGVAAAAVKILAALGRGTAYCVRQPLNVLRGLAVAVLGMVAAVASVAALALFLLLI